MELLANSSMSLKEIAAETGFYNEQAFCAAFKARAGMTPGRYRRLKQG
jgi:AraC-like DNA-binding protein